jgi:hypothetical protein
MKGFVIPLPRIYQRIAMKNIKKIRNDFNCKAPIEIWEAGNELEQADKTEIAKFGGISFRNTDEFGENAQSWRGYQIKAFAAYHSHFSEFVLCDADVRFLQEPLLPFQSDGYRETGCYFFRDLKKWKFSRLSDNQKKFHNIDFFEKRKAWIRTLMPKESPYFPVEWGYIYDDEIPVKPVAEAYMESGVVYMNKEIHNESMKLILEMNTQREISYSVIHGGKEIWWIGCCISGNPFYMNPQYPVFIHKLIQSIGMKPFYVQK